MAAAGQSAASSVADVAASTAQTAAAATSEVPATAPKLGLQVTKDVDVDDTRAYEYELYAPDGTKLATVKLADDDTVTFSGISKPAEGAYVIKELADGQPTGAQITAQVSHVLSDAGVIKSYLVKYSPSGEFAKLPLEEAHESETPAVDEVSDQTDSGLEISAEVTPAIYKQPLSVKVTKDVDLDDTRAYEYDLVDPEGNVLQTVSLADDDSVKFAPVEGAKAGEYTVVEKADGQPTGATITAKVSEIGTGYNVEYKATEFAKLPLEEAHESETPAVDDVSDQTDSGLGITAEITKPEDEKPIYKQPLVVKVMKSVDVDDTRAYEYDLVDPYGNVVQTVTLADDGTVKFSAIEKPVLGFYTIVEKADGVATGAEIGATVSEIGTGYDVDYQPAGFGKLPMEDAPSGQSDMPMVDDVDDQTGEGVHITVEVIKPDTDKGDDVLVDEPGDDQKSDDMNDDKSDDMDDDKSDDMDDKKFDDMDDKKSDAAAEKAAEKSKPQTKTMVTKKVVTKTVTKKDATPKTADVTPIAQIAGMAATGFSLVAGAFVAFADKRKKH